MVCLNTVFDLEFLKDTYLDFSTPLRCIGNNSTSSLWGEGGEEYFHTLALNCLLQWK